MIFNFYYAIHSNLIQFLIFILCVSIYSKQKSLMGWLWLAIGTIDIFQISAKFNFLHFYIFHVSYSSLIGSHLIILCCIFSKTLGLWKAYLRSIKHNMELFKIIFNVKCLKFVFASHFPFLKDSLQNWKKYFDRHFLQVVLLGKFSNIKNWTMLRST
jgi:hypothetical protein